MCLIGTPWHTPIPNTYLHGIHGTVWHHAQQINMELCMSEYASLSCLTRFELLFVCSAPLAEGHGFGMFWPRSACTTLVSSRPETANHNNVGRGFTRTADKALHLNGLLPRVMSGTSAGSIVF